MTWLFMLSLLPPSVQNACAESTIFTNEHFGFSVAYPPSMVPIPSTHPEAGLLLKSKGASYPTFNVVTQAGRYAADELTAPKQEQMILDSYRLVGLTDIKQRASYFSTINGQTCFNLELQYSQSGTRLISSATVVSGTDRHFILTYIDQADTFSQNLSVRDGILSSFAVMSANEVPLKPKDEPVKHNLVLFIFLIAVLPCSYLIYVALRNSARI
ncbi:hypothetical protein OAO01_05300 [Oligoflexia bacterium]|nr:hypothetical protein [Oligoflexia bacterium]